VHPPFLSLNTIPPVNKSTNPPQPAPTNNPPLHATNATPTGTPLTAASEPTGFERTDAASRRAVDAQRAAALDEYSARAAHPEQRAGDVGGDVGGEGAEGGGVDNGGKGKGVRGAEAPGGEEAFTAGERVQVSAD